MVVNVNFPKHHWTLPKKWSSWWLKRPVETYLSDWKNLGKFWVENSSKTSFNLSKRSEILITLWFSLLSGLPKNEFDWSFYIAACYSNISPKANTMFLELLAWWLEKVQQQPNDDFMVIHRAKAVNKKISPETNPSVLVRGLGQLVHEFFGFIQVTTLHLFWDEPISNQSKTRTIDDPEPHLSTQRTPKILMFQF